MLNKIINTCIIFLIIAFSFSLFLQIYSKQEMKDQSGNLSIVYTQSREFLNDFYSRNVNNTYAQLETRDVYSDGYVTKEKWKEIIQKDVEQQTLIEILKPTSSSDISYILHSNTPKETYLVRFSLSVNYMGHKKTRTGEIEYIKTDNGFKIHSFEVDILYADGRWGLY